MSYPRSSEGLHCISHLNSLLLTALVGLTVLSIRSTVGTCRYGIYIGI